MDTSNMVFVFGSNLAGVHGAGAARYAVRYKGALYGNGVGRTGNSYAIPTKNKQIRTLTIGSIRQWIEEFLEYAEMHPNELFQVTQIGCGLAGYQPDEIAPWFKDASDNCYFDEAWKPYLGDSKKYWGTK